MGSIRLRRKPNVWELRLYLGRDENGKVIHKYATFVGGKRVSEKELARLSFELESEPEYPEPELKLGERAEQIRWGLGTTFNDAILAGKEKQFPSTAQQLGITGFKGLGLTVWPVSSSLG